MALHKMVHYLSLFLLHGLFMGAEAQTSPPEIGVAAYAFDMSQVSLDEGRWLENQNRTLSYLRWIDPDRLLYNFRANHRVSTQNAQPLGGWDAPNFPFRTHSQGHFLTAWSFCYAVLKDQTCRDRATYFAAELAKCQANNKAAGFNDGYLSGFPESEIQKVEDRTLTSGNVPYYSLHKTLAGLLDVWRHTGDQNAKNVLLNFAAWVDWRTGRLNYNQMQSMLQTEFGGMNEVMADLYQQTGDKRWLKVAERFYHAAALDPLAARQDKLNGQHANTNVPKWIGVARQFKGTGIQKYRDIAFNAWDFTVKAHTYAIGGNSQSEHFRAPNAIAGYLAKDTCEACNTYNMLKLTRELWLINPKDSSYFDYYEKALINHLIGIQNPSSEHGHITYFTSLNPGGYRGVGPAWGGGTYSTDHDSFWCCQSTALEVNTKLMDSVYFYDANTLFVNQFTPTTLRWTDRKTTITQRTTFPESDTSTLTVDGEGEWTMAIRIPSWTKDATIKINGQPANVNTSPGSYARIQRAWKKGDAVTVKLPFSIRTIPANDDRTLAAIAYGPVVLSGNYGSETLNKSPSLKVGDIKHVSGLQFSVNVDGRQRTLGPFYEAHGFNYNVYWRIS